MSWNKIIRVAVSLWLQTTDRCTLSDQIYKLLENITESQNSRGWKGPLWVI